MKKEICGMDFQRAKHERMNSFCLDIYRNDPSQPHGYKYDGAKFANSEQRARRITALFMAWFSKCGTSLERE